MKTKFEDFIKDYSIFVDMDGVLTDFDGDFKKYFLNNFNKENNTNIKNGWEYEDKYGANNFWKEISKIGLKFWSDMSWKNDGKKLWNFVKNYNTQILTKPSKDELSKQGKIIWCKRELNIIPIISNKKEEYVKNNKCILIDDLEKNINAWINKGGIGILHRNTEDTIKKLKEIL